MFVPPCTVEYQKGQLVYLLQSGVYEKKNQPGLIRLSPDGRTIVIASAASLTFFSAITGNILNTITDIYSGGLLHASVHSPLTVYCFPHLLPFLYTPVFVYFIFVMEALMSLNMFAFPRHSPSFPLVW